MKKIRFVKDTAVDYWVSRYDEMDTRTYYRGTIVEYAALEKLDATHVNIHFDNNDLAVDVPVNSFESVS